MDSVQVGVIENGKRKQEENFKVLRSRIDKQNRLNGIVQ